eukprot:CAMPEP_0181231752 /NCGR_PEP_ID=MMETSP1096-20121128/35297_1 /TAXON_ID=156174 ORGANISM="Chrysochromulina ericina, Strain CCMP281" /NCGR_SAMPLE_ID=MMETSP1096 /ASSEMBLY_ACC=CAM_ASM_000453 /LENGTH=123 /DNA_ID=CAMNT_0023325861 /DNA_START=154 /DNA_END=522 /DNA_ORIENTATION=-
MREARRLLHHITRSGRKGNLPAIGRGRVEPKATPRVLSKSPHTGDAPGHGCCLFDVYPVARHLHELRLVAILTPPALVVREVVDGTVALLLCVALAGALLWVGNFSWAVLDVIASIPSPTVVA